MGLFLYKTKQTLFSYLIMIRLLPNSNSQTIKIIPRDNTSLSNISLIITEDGTNKSETLTSLNAAVNGNFTHVPITSTILKEGSSYYLQFSKNSSLWYRDKAYVTSQTNDEAIHTLNTNKYDQYGEGSEDEYIVL